MPLSFHTKLAPYLFANKLDHFFVEHQLKIMLRLL